MSAPSKHYTQYAFPRPSVEITEELRDYGQTGMTLRDWFAGQAIKAVWADASAHANAGLIAKSDDQAVQLMCRAAWTLADKMLAAREAQP